MTAAVRRDPDDRERLPASATARRRQRGMAQRRRPLLALLVALALIAYFAFVFVLPLTQAIWYSLNVYDIQTGDSRLVGLRNYVEMVDDPKFWTGLRVSLTFALGQFVLGTTVAIALGWMYTTVRGVARVLTITLIALPALLPTMAVVIFWKALLVPDRGLLDMALAALGLPSVGWLTDANWAMFWSIAMTTWKYVGFGAILWMSGLNSISREILEAAELDAAGPVRRFVAISLPILSPLLLYQFVTSMIDLIQFIDPFIALTRGGPAGQTEALILYAYTEGFVRLNFGYASAITVAMMVLLLAFSFLQLRRWRSLLEAA